MFYFFLFCFFFVLLFCCVFFFLKIISVNHTTRIRRAHHKVKMTGWAIPTAIKTATITATKDHQTVIFRQDHRQIKHRHGKGRRHGVLHRHHLNRHGAPTICLVCHVGQVLHRSVQWVQRKVTKLIGQTSHQCDRAVHHQHQAIPDQTVLTSKGNAYFTRHIPYSLTICDRITVRTTHSILNLISLAWIKNNFFPDMKFVFVISIKLKKKIQQEEKNWIAWLFLYFILFFFVGAVNVKLVYVFSCLLKESWGVLWLISYLMWFLCISIRRCEGGVNLLFCQIIFFPKQISARSLKQLTYMCVFCLLIAIANSKSLIYFGCTFFLLLFSWNCIRNRSAIRHTNRTQTH